MAQAILPSVATILKNPNHGGIDSEKYGFLLFVFVIGAILSSIFFKWLLLYFSRSKLLLMGYLSYLCGTSFFSLDLFLNTSNISLFSNYFFALFFLGLGHGIMNSILNLYSMEENPKYSSALITGLHTSFGLGAATTPLLANFMFQNYIWQVVVFITQIFFFFFCFIFFKVIPKENKQEVKIKNIKSEIPKLPALVYLLTGVIFVYVLVESIIAYWSLEYLQKNFQIGLQESTQALSAYWLMVSIGRLFILLYSIYYRERILFHFLPLFTTVVLFFLVFKVNINVLYIYFLLGLGCSAFYPLTTSIALNVSSKARERVSGLIVASGVGSVGVANFLIGFSLSKGWAKIEEIFYIGVGLSLFLFIVLLLVPKLEKHINDAKTLRL